MVVGVLELQTHNLNFPGQLPASVTQTLAPVAAARMAAVNVTVSPGAVFLTCHSHSETQTPPNLYYPLDTAETNQNVIVNKCKENSF